MANRRLLLLLKPLEMCPVGSSANLGGKTNPQVLSYLNDRCKVHQDAINICQNILQKKLVDWRPLCRNNLSHLIHDVDLVVTIGGDGTLLQASHFVDDKIPILGVNSDPTQVKEVEEFHDQFDAHRSTGFLCAATIKNFERVLDDILDGRRSSSELSRMSVRVNSQLLSTPALNDVLIAHPCPAAVSRFSFRTRSDEQLCTPLVHYRSSGFRVSTATGSTAAMHSAGGFVMPIISRDLQYMVREPISPESVVSKLMHGLVRPGQSLDVSWFSREGAIYFDGPHVFHTIQHGDIIRISADAPVLKVFLPQHLLSDSCK